MRTNVGWAIGGLRLLPVTAAPAWAHHAFAAKFDAKQPVEFQETLVSGSPLVPACQPDGHSTAVSLAAAADCSRVTRVCDAQS
jgi:hypothetical protein